MNLDAIAARAQLLAALPGLTDAHVVALARLVALGNADALRAELRAVVDLETKGQTHALVPLGTSGDRLFTKGLALQVLDRLTRGT